MAGIPHDDDEEISVSMLDALKARVEECVGLNDFVGEFKRAFDSHSHEYAEHSQELEDFMEDVRDQLEKLTKDLGEAKDKSTTQDIELMNIIKALTSTFDKETYDRFAQAEEMQEKIDDLLLSKGDARAGQWESTKFQDTTKKDPKAAVNKAMLDDLKKNITDQVNRQVNEIKASQKEQQAKFSKEIAEVSIRGTVSNSSGDGSGDNSRIQESVNVYKEQLSKIQKETHERFAEADERHSKTVLLSSFEDIVTRVNTWESRFSGLETLVNNMELSMKGTITAQIQEAMRSHATRTDTLKEQQLSWESRLEQVMSQQTTKGTGGAVSEDIETRLATQETRLLKLTQEISMQLQDVMRDQKRSADEMAEQQARLQSNTCDLQLQLTNLKNSVSSMTGVPTPPVATSGIAANGIVDTSDTAMASIADLKAQTTFLMQQETVSKSVLEDQISKVKQLISQSGGGGAPAITDAVTKSEFEMAKKDLWEAVTQLQIKQVEASKQKAQAAYATYQDVSGTAPTLVQASTLSGSPPVYKAPAPGAATPPGPRPGSVSPARVVVRQASSPNVRYQAAPGAPGAPVQQALNGVPGSPRVQIIRQTSQGPLGMPLPTTTSFTVAGTPAQQPS